jgi:polyhydroxyalkanoate synthesis regulator phasin
MKTIGKAEIAKIHIWKSRLGMDEESYRALLSGFPSASLGTSGVPSSKDLSYADYRDLRTIFLKLLNAAGMATDAQLMKIRNLAKGTVKNLPGFCSKIVSRTVKNPGDLQAHEARKVIEALKRYHKNDTSAVAQCPTDADDRRKTMTSMDGLMPTEAGTPKGRLTPLEIKKVNNYRAAQPGDIRCGECENSRYRDILGWNLQSFGKQWRCLLIGLDYPKAEKICHADTCDKAIKREEVPVKEDV